MVENKSFEAKNDELREIIGLAKEGLWDNVDERLADIGDNPEFVEWAKTKGVSDADGNLRDLAVTILQNTESELGADMTDKLRAMMISDKNEFVQYRSSFALANHGDRSKTVIDKIKDAVEVPDVKDVALKILIDIGVRSEQA